MYLPVKVDDQVLYFNRVKCIVKNIDTSKDTPRYEVQAEHSGKILSVERSEIVLV